MISNSVVGSAYVSENFSHAIYQDYDADAGTFSISIRDLESGTVTLLGTGADGTLDARFSAEGSKAVFVSSSGSLVPGDTNGGRDVFVVDLATGRVTRVSTTAGGAQANGISFDPDISPDGTKVVFASTADNLVANDTNGQGDIYLKDLVTGQVTRVSKARDGGFSQVSSSGPRFANDGTTILFGSRATDLTLDPIPSPGGRQSYAYDLDERGVVPVTLDATAAGPTVDSITVSPGDGSSPEVITFTSFLRDGKRAFLHYRADGDYTATFTASAGGTVVATQTLDVAIRAFSGAAQTFVGDAGHEIVLLSGLADRADGGAGDDALYGAAGSDILKGGLGNDALDGGTGADRLEGGAGDDRYVVDNPGDLVIEAAGAGTDTVSAVVAYTLGEAVENLVLLGAASIAGTGNASANAITGNAGGNVLTGLAGDDRLDGEGGNDRLDGGIGNDVLLGGGGTNLLLGGEGNDRLYAGGGRDRLEGGAGNDVYAVGDARNTVVEGADAGIDIVTSFVSWTLSANVENLSLKGRDTNGTGNALANRITGTDGDNALQGLEGNDTLVGGAGDDSLAGGAGDDALDGGSGGDRLDGQAGADRLAGGADSDTYLVDNSGDQVVEAAGQGIDTVLAGISYALAAGQEIEILQFVDPGARQALNLRGNAFANTLRGNAGANRLDGGGGGDQLFGGLGNDLYNVDNSGDRVFEAARQGNDTVVSTISYALAAGQEIETLQLAPSTGTAALKLVGNAFANTLIGNAGGNGMRGWEGDDTLDGREGADLLYGDGGNDTYRVDHSGDRAFETISGGFDTVVSTISYALATGQEIEVLQLAGGTGRAALNLSGNEFANTLRGNDGNNGIDGRGGADLLYGGKGDDTYKVDDGDDLVFEAVGQGRDTVLASVSYALAAGQEVESLQLAPATATLGLDLTGNAFAQGLTGNAGANRLDGGLGADMLTGRAGADSFVFATALGSGNVDRITDFAAEDTIRLADAVFTALDTGALAATRFKNISAAGADADDRILYKQATGELFYDADGSGAGGAVLFATLDNRAALTAADFLVI